MNDEFSDYFYKSRQGGNSVNHSMNRQQKIFLQKEVIFILRDDVWPSFNKTKGDFK